MDYKDKVAKLAIYIRECMKNKNRKVFLFKLISGITIPLLIWIFSPKAYLGFWETLYLIFVINYCIYQKSPKEKKSWSIAIVLVTAVLSFWVNHSVSPFISPNIASFVIKNNYINSVFSPLPSFSFESADNYKDSVKESDFYLTQEAECKIRFPLFPLVRFIVIPMKEPTVLYPETLEGEFKDYEINPFIESIYEKDNQIFVKVKPQSSLNIIESIVTFTYRRKFTNRLRFPVSFNLQKIEGKDAFLLDIRLANNKPFLVKNLFYIEEDFVKKFTLGEFSDNTKYKRTSVCKNVGDGVVNMDKQGNLFIMQYSPVGPGEETHFYLELERIPNIGETK